MRRHARVSAWYRLAVVVLQPLAVLITRRDWQGDENLPRTGGIVVCPNHISYSDPVIAAHFLWCHGQVPRFLGKQSVFDIWFFGRMLRGAGQIPVRRGTGEAGHAYQAGASAVAAGECVVVYPEGTLTRDAALWPMRGKTGAARMSLTTGCPVIPLAMWGPQRILFPYSKRPHLLPPTRVHVMAGRPVSLDDLRVALAAPGVDESAVLVEATERIMSAITGLLAELRGESPPERRLDPRTDPGAWGSSQSEM